MLLPRPQGTARRHLRLSRDRVGTTFRTGSAEQPWDVVLYVDAGASDEQLAALADIFLGRASGTVARLYGPAIGEV
jgi:hypothetical protein